MTTSLSANELKKMLPTLARHEGVWEGHYRYYDANGKQTDMNRGCFAVFRTLATPITRPITIAGLMESATCATSRLRSKMAA